MTRDERAKTFEHSKKVVDQMVKSGQADNHQARQMIEGARKNLQNATLNREMDKFQK